MEAKLRWVNIASTALESHGLPGRSFVNCYVRGSGYDYRGDLRKSGSSDVSINGNETTLPKPQQLFAATSVVRAAITGASRRAQSTRERNGDILHCLGETDGP